MLPKNHVFKQSHPIEQKPTTFPAKARGFFAVDGELKRFGLHLAAGETAERAERKTNHFPGAFAGGGGEKLTLAEFARLADAFTAWKAKQA